jgi:hypothetical protein
MVKGDDKGVEGRQMEKTKKQFIDYGCGFPVILEDIPMVQVRGVWTPDINYEDFHKAVLRALAHKPFRLTGNEIKFVRHFFGLTLAQFGDYFDVSHPAVLKWDGAGDDLPNIKWSTERDVRLFILDKLNETPSRIGELYQGLRKAAAPPKNNKLNLGDIFSSPAA